MQRHVSPLSSSITENSPQLQTPVSGFTCASGPEQPMQWSQNAINPVGHSHIIVCVITSPDAEVKPEPETAPEPLDPEPEPEPEDDPSKT
jgi:hypothetical protein